MLYITNNRASYDYTCIQSYLAGINLKGTEVRQIRNRKGSLKGAFCYFKDSDLFLKGFTIPELSCAKFNNHNPERDKQLLLTKKELKYLKKEVESPGITIIPLEIIECHGLFKVNIMLAKGKKEYDKRQSIKDRENKRNLDRLKKLK